MALGGSVSDFFAIEAVAPWLSQAPNASVGPFGGGLHVAWPTGVFTPEIVLGMVDNSLRERQPQLEQVKPPSEASSITAGEQVGYVDFEIPVGLPNPDYVFGGVLGSVIASATGAGIPPIFNGSVGSSDGPFPGAPVSDRPAFPEGSIFGPGGTWGDSPLPPDIYDIPYEDTGPNQ